MFVFVDAMLNPRQALVKLPIGRISAALFRALL